MAGVTITKEFHTKIGSPPLIVLGIFKVQFDDNYPDGGEVVDLSPYFRKIHAVIPVNTEDAPGYLFVPDDSNFGTPASFKLLAHFFDYNGGADAKSIDATGEDLALVYARILVIGE